MKHVAERLVRYSDSNKVIHIDDVKDVALKRLAKDRRINDKIRSALKDIDDQLELLVPRQVDDHALQFKRYLQREFGTTINLSKLHKEHPSKYRKLQYYGKPSEVIKEWGLSYKYDRNLEVKNFKKLLGGLSKGQVIHQLYALDKKLYMALTYQARKEGKSVKEYVKKLGFILE